MKYAFVLGKNKDLSIAELASVFPDSKINECGDMALVDCTLPYPPQETLNRLGGSLKILEIFEEGTFDTALPILAGYIDAQLTGKKIFGVNILNANHAKEQQELKLLLPALKKSLSGENKVRFVNNQNKNVSEVFAKKQKLVEHGIEINCIVREDGSVLFGKTVAIQDFEDYSRRDYGKPVRDAKTGMLPPKLAQIMINLSITRDNAGGIPAIYDPFCGTGTVLTEAMLMRYDVAGSDNNKRMVEAAGKNTRWMQSTYGTCKAVRIFEHDAATSFPKLFDPDKTMAIVTEPYLGPPLRHAPTTAECVTIFDELSHLYISFFKNIHAVIPAGTVLVVIFPYIKTKSGRLHLAQHNDLLDEIKRSGFEVSALYNRQKSLLYDRPDQMVGREILRLVASR